MNATYTMTLWDYLNQKNPLFDFYYYMWDESQRERIQQLFVDTFLFREICVDNPQYFHHLFKTRWLLHWPYYNQLYESASLKFNPLSTHETITQSETNEKTKESENSALLGTTHNDGRISNASTSHTNALNSHVADTKHQEVENTNRDIDYVEGTTTDSRGTADTTEDTTENKTENSNRTIDKTASENLNRTITAHSDRDTTGTSTTDSTSSNSHSDYPQANIAAISPENPGAWVTWTEDQKGHSQTNTSGNEQIDNSETTEQTTSQNDTTTEDFNSTTDTTGKRVTDTDTTDHAEGHKHSITNDDTHRKLNAKTGLTEDSTENTDVKEYSNQTSKSDGVSQQAGSRDTQGKRDIGYSRRVSGYENKSPAELIMLWRESLINIDKDFLSNFESLFMEVY